MKRAAPPLWFFAMTLFLPTSASSQPLPELFQTLKTQIRSGSWEAALSTLGTLQTESSKPGQDDARAKLEGPIAFYRGVCQANLDQKPEAIEAFQTFLAIQPNATIDGTIYSAKAVAAFEAARKASVDQALSLAEAYNKFRIPGDAPERDTVDAYWADGPVRWIMTPEEKKAWSALEEPNARTAFVEEFWNSRSTLPGTESRTFRQEFDRRVAFADANFVQDPEQRGSVTDRGMVFVLLGPPTYADRMPLRTGDDKNDDAGMTAKGSQDAKLAQKRGPSGHMGQRGVLNVMDYQYAGVWNRGVATDGELEVWHYDRELLPAGVPYQQVDVHYVTKKGYGVKVMQREAPISNTLGSAARHAAPVSRSLSAARR